MIYDWVGTPKSRDVLERELNEWIMLYASEEGSAEDVLLRDRWPMPGSRLWIWPTRASRVIFTRKPTCVRTSSSRASKWISGVVSKIPK